MYMQKQIIRILAFVFTFSVGLSIVLILHLFSFSETEKTALPVKDSSVIETTTTTTELEKEGSDLTESDSIKLNPCPETNPLKSLSRNSLENPSSKKWRRVSLGVVNGKVYCGDLPEYPAEVKGKHISAIVNVRVNINESGDIVGAYADTKNLHLRKTAEKAAFQTRVTPMLLRGESFKAFGVLVYQFDSEQGVSLVHPSSLKKIFKQYNQ